MELGDYACLLPGRGGEGLCEGAGHADCLLDEVGEAPHAAEVVDVCVAV